MNYPERYDIYLPVLLILHLDIRDLPKNLSDIFFVLVNLQNFTLTLAKESMKIRCRCPASPYGSIVVSAPQLCNFNSFGIFLITFGVLTLRNVNFKVKELI